MATVEIEAFATSERSNHHKPPYFTGPLALEECTLQHLRVSERLEYKRRSFI